MNILTGGRGGKILIFCAQDVKLLRQIKRISINDFDFTFFLNRNFCPGVAITVPRPRRL